MNKRREQNQHSAECDGPLQCDQTRVHSGVDKLVTITAVLPFPMIGTRYRGNTAHFKKFVPITAVRGNWAEEDMVRGCAERLSSTWIE